MIIPGTQVIVTCNTGAKKAQCIHILGGTRKKYATLGDEIVVAIKEANPKGQVKKGDVARAVIVRATKEKRRPDGSYIRFDQKAVVLINKEREPRGTRVFGPVARDELRDKFPKILSQAPESV